MDPKAGDISLPVDLIRTVAIILVILLHAAVEPYQIADLMSPAGVSSWWSVNIYDSIARPCVPLFVMLTGALLLQPSKSNEPLGVYFKKRLNRIALPFVFWGAAYFAWRAFVNHETLTSSSILQGILMGPYNHFWFLYILVGLYLIAPLLRILVGYADWKLIRYFLLLWFTGTALVPLISLLTPYSLNGGVFIMTGWLGYFLLGAYIQRMQWRTLTLYILVFSGYVLTILATYVVTGTIGERVGQFFYDASSANVILTSVAMFLLLNKVSSAQLNISLPRANRLLHLISQYTLPIYLMHVMVMETLQKGYLGFQISLATMDPVLEIPLITAITFFITLGIVILLKKIPIIRRLIG
ncbi:MAG: acyltransferase [Candidatus Bathyarchaeia archaeon]